MTQVNPVNGIDQAASLTADNTSNDSAADFTTYMDGNNTTLKDIFEKASKTYNIPIDLLTAVAKTESNFNVNDTSSSGAQGVMQLMPIACTELGVTDAYDPEQNIMGGAKLLAKYLNKYNGDIPLTLASYNAGAGAVAKYGGVPPYKETQNYVKKVVNFMNEGVSVPDVNVTSSGAAVKTGESYTGTSDVQSSSSNDVAVLIDKDSAANASSIIDDVFTYEDYLKFLNLYFDTILYKQQEEEEDQLKQQYQISDNNKKDPSKYPYYEFQQIKYNNSVMGLLNS